MSGDGVVGHAVREGQAVHSGDCPSDICHGSFFGVKLAARTISKADAGSVKRYCCS